MLYKGARVEYINPVVYLGEEFKDKGWEENQRYFKKKVKNLKFKYGFVIEGGISDRIKVYMDRLNRTSESVLLTVNTLSEVFDNVKINLTILPMDAYTEGVARSIDISVDEFE